MVFRISKSVFLSWRIKVYENYSMYSMKFIYEIRIKVFDFRGKIHKILRFSFVCLVTVSNIIEFMKINYSIIKYNLPRNHGVKLKIHYLVQYKSFYFQQIWLGFRKNLNFLENLMEMNSLRRFHSNTLIRLDIFCKL